MYCIFKVMYEFSIHQETAADVITDHRVHGQKHQRAVYNYNW